jgi:hypothetical protein
VDRVVRALAGGLLLAGCAADPAPDPPAPVPPSAACPPSADLVPAEQQGTGDGVTLWALFFSARAVTGQETKAVWRITGAGDLTLTAVGPSNTSVTPTWGPELHQGSSFDRPGDEFGTGWIFPAPGCWTFTATRGQHTANLTIRVA